MFVKLAGFRVYNTLQNSVQKGRLWTSHGSQVMVAPPSVSSEVKSARNGCRRPVRHETNQAGLSREETLQLLGSTKSPLRPNSWRSKRSESIALCRTPLFPQSFLPSNVMLIRLCKRTTVDYYLGQQSFDR